MNFEVALQAINALNLIVPMVEGFGTASGPDKLAAAQALLTQFVPAAAQPAVAAQVTGWISVIVALNNLVGNFKKAAPAVQAPAAGGIVSGLGTILSAFPGVVLPAGLATAQAVPQ